MSGQTEASAPGAGAASAGATAGVAAAAATAGAPAEATAAAGSATVGEAMRAAGAAARLPDLTYGEAETELRAAVRSVLDDKAAWPAVLARTETAQTYDTALWRTLAAEVGCAGLLVPESYGGAGASFREAAVVAEEVGRSVAPVPFLGSAVIATVALLEIVGAEHASAAGAAGAGAGVAAGASAPRAGAEHDADGAGAASGADVAAGAGAARADAEHEAAAELLAGLAAGTTTAALVVPFASMPGVRPQPSVRLVPAPAEGGDVGGYRLTGSVAGVADALPADVLLVPVDGVPFGLYVVQASAAGVDVTGVTSLDMTRQLADIKLDAAPARRIAAGPAAERAIAGALSAGAAMLAAEQLGLADRALEITLDYVKHRYQFARPVGSFQALKHRLADLWVAVTQARAASRYAAACLAEGDADAPVAVALAKAACSDVALLTGQEMVQLHGGIGFTWEHPAHLYLKRAKSSSIALGTADRHRASLAGLVDLPPAPR